MMGLYQFKEFLDFNDIIDYFRDLKVYNAPLGYSEQARIRIKGILLEFIQTGKLTPVFYYDGIVKEDFDLDSISFYIKAWICVNEKIVKDLFFDNELGTKTIDLNIKDYLKVHKVGKNITYGVNYQKKIDKMEGFIFMDTNRYKIELDGGDFFDEDNLPQEPKTQAEKRMEILYEILDDMKLRAEQDPNANISIDNYKDKLPKTIKNDIWLTFDDLLYPKSQLDAIFNPTQTNTETTTLQTQLDQAHARIAELEQQLNKQPPTTNPVANITQEMQIINEVYSEFWKNHKSNEIPPKKEIIVSWIKSNYGISDRIANAIDTIVRPEQYRTGGQKAR